MSKSELAAIILAAGQGTRMKSETPKVLHKVAGRAMVLHVLDRLAELDAGRTVVVIAPDLEAVRDAVSPVPTAIQKKQLGTADAVKAARAGLDGFTGTVLVLYGDTPLIGTETLRDMAAARDGPDNHAVVVLGFRPVDPGAYGRLVTDPDGTLQAIVEAKDANRAQLAITLCNSGVMAIDGALLFELLDAVGNDNAKGEYYLTDIVEIARRRNLSCGYIEADEAELQGVNDRRDLARAEAEIQRLLRDRVMAGGATLVDPETVYLSADTKLGRDVTVGPNVVFGPGVVVGDKVEVRAFSHLEGATIAEGAIVGPFARLRPGARLDRDARVGNFVEIKNAVLGEGAKANHLSYIGDASVGALANIGAGTITCNYDGFFKSQTVIGKAAFIGSNTALVAPVTVGDGAIIGAGSTITRDIDEDALGVTRAAQKHIPGAAKRFRDTRQAAKDKAAKKKSS